MPTSYSLSSEAETEALAGRIASRLERGDVLLLEGPIGAGKTFFARALIQARLAVEGRHEDVPSPTFTLVQVYEAGDTEIWHVDLYRVSGAGDATELGLAEAFETAICLVEWPDRLGAARPGFAITLTFAAGAGETERDLRVAGNTTRWQELVGEGPFEQ